MSKPVQLKKFQLKKVQRVKVGQELVQRNKSSQKRRRVASALIALFLFGLVACENAIDSTSDTRSSASLVLHSCESTLGQSRPALKRAQCGRLSVPENPERPEARQVNLNILRLPAIASSPKPDPLFVFAGGPGQAATELVDRLPALFRKVNLERDVVFVDQRGTGQSNPLDCAADENVDFSLSTEESFARQEAQLRECLASYDADLRYYTTPFAIDDINGVREALGYSRINLWGGSYGTRAALIYMRRHPESVRTAVLDSVAPVAIQLPHHTSRDADDALRRLFSVCEQQPACRQRYPDLAGTTRKLIRELDRSPRMLELEHPLTGKELRVRLSGELFAGLIRLGLYQRELGPMLPLIVSSAAQGDFRPLAPLLTFTEQVSDSMSVGMQQTILCAEDLRRRAPVLAERDPILQLNPVEQMQQVCEFWPEGILPEGYFEPVASDTPVLLLSGELDPVTPPRWGDLAAETLGNSLHVRVPGAHHMAGYSGCVDDLIVDFIEQGSVQRLDTSCVENVRPLPPFVSPAGPAMTAEGGSDD